MDQDPVIVLRVGERRQQIADGFAARRAAAAQNRSRRASSPITSSNQRSPGATATWICCSGIAAASRSMLCTSIGLPSSIQYCLGDVAAKAAAAPGRGNQRVVAHLERGAGNGGRVRTANCGQCGGRGDPPIMRPTTHGGCRSTSFRAADGPRPARRRRSRARSRRRSAGTLRRFASPLSVTVFWPST